MTLIEAFGMLMVIIPDGSAAAYRTDYDEWCYLTKIPYEYEVVGKAGGEWNKCKYEKYQVQAINVFEKPDNPNRYNLRQNWR